ncbi:phosphopantetheine-binding protein [Frankia sp. R82]|uniref:phosphopantetheine-binding protein n=1 Tax=Frankia sp. R82 TaxID=2950553 RepID=UPI0020438183|nr:phosphopantetheine-binding protein [Frankia sp. R82]MCM3885416.1 phosphopantetheine-binding protein [Frankia sp. R82]
MDRSAVEARVLAEITEDVRDVIGEEYAFDMDITMDTSFGDDLELESIEFVALADRLRERYGAAVDFVGFLATRDVDQVINMRIGEVVEFVVDSQSTPVTTGSI